MKQKIKLLLTEDLSPHRISLLFLISLYCSNELEKISSRPILNLLIKFLENDTLYDENGERLTIPTLNDLCYNIDRVYNGKEAQEHTSYQNSDQLKYLLLKALWDIKSVEELDHAFTQFEACLVDVKNIISDPKEIVKRISKHSFLGSFIHRTTTAFKLLEFEEIFILYESFVEYRESTRDLFTSIGGYSSKSKSVELKEAAKEEKLELEDSLFFSRLNTQLSQTIGIKVPINTDDTEQVTKLVPVPKHDLQVLLDKQINILENNGTKTPQMLKDIMYLMTYPDSRTSLIQNISFNNSPSFYYIQYLESLKESNYNGAFQALHQYFDYMVSNNSKYFYHFALISRASLHQYFGENEKAIDAIEEAISVARENKDNITLTYILSWLFNFLQNNPDLWKRQSFYNNNDESQLLYFLIKKSQLVSLLLYSLSYNVEALQILNNGGSMNKYLESLLKGTYISINDNITSFVKSIELSASIWGRIGVPSLCEAYCDISLESCEKKSDKISIKIRSLFLKFLKGETESAYNELEQIKSEVMDDHTLYSMVQIRSLIMLTKLNLMKGRYNISKEIVDVLLKSDIKDINLKEELILLQIEVELSLENSQTALTIISNSLKQATFHSNMYFVIKLNLLKCQIFDNTGCQSRAMSLIIQQLQQGQKIGLATIIAEGMILLLSMLNNMENYEDAYSLHDQILPVIVSVDILDFTSLAYFEIARTYLGLYQKDTSNNKLFNKVLKFLNLSISGFKYSVHNVKLSKCFELENELALLKGEQSLIDHAKTSLEKVHNRTKDDSTYGYVIQK